MEVEIMKRRSGFTLIEMMIVLAIIAALSATLVPIAMNALNQAKVTQNLTELESIRLAAMQYYYKYDNIDISDLSPLDNYLDLEKLTTNASYTVHDSTDATNLYIKVDFNQNDEALSKALAAQYPETSETTGTRDTNNNTFLAWFYFE
jgi:general secretion pathway protein G